MPSEVRIPALGVAMEEAVLTAWLKSPGEVVEEQEPIAEIETDKATMELVSPVRGTLGAHRFPAGASVPVGGVVSVVYAVGEPESAERTGEPAPAGEVEQPDDAGEERAALTGGDSRQSAAAEGIEPRRPHRKSPRARARERAGRASDGVESPTAADGIRQAIAQRLSASWRTIPHFSVTLEIDVEALLAALASARQSVCAVNLTDLMLRAHAFALATRTTTTDIDLALAVATERGVLAPVIRGVPQLRLEELAAVRAAATARGRAGRLTEDDAVVPLSTLSNLGPFGIDSFTGVIAVEQTTLLTIGRVRPALRPAGDTAAVRHVMTATLNADHRALDGADAAALLTAFAAALETPDRLIVAGGML